MLNKVVNKTGRAEDNPSILNKVVNTTAIDKDLVEANPILQTVVNTIDPLPSQSSGGNISSCVIACIDKNIKDVQCVTCINTCEIDNIKNTTCVSLEKVNADYVCSNTLSSSCIEVGKISAEDANVGTLYAQCICYDSIQVKQCTSSPKAVVTVGLCSSYKVCVDDDTVYSEKVCSDNFYGYLKGKASNTDCFDGKTFEEAKANILSGKAKCSELADYAKNLCIESCSDGSGFIPFVDNKCVMFLAQDYNPKVMFDKDGICINLDGAFVTKDINAVCSCSRDAVTDRLEVKQCASFNGPVYIYDNIYQCGESWCTHAQNIYTCSDTITMREGATFAGNAQIKVSKYDGTNNGVIFLGTDGTLRVGDENNCQPVLTRSEEKDLTDGHVLVWDSTNRCAKDSGEGVVTCSYVNAIGTACKEEACLYAACTDSANRTWTDGLVCSVGTECYKKACSCALNTDKLCYACSSSYTDTKSLCSCVWSSSCGHAIGSSCKEASCLYTSCTDGSNKTWTSACICESCINSYNHADCVGTECYKKACLCSVVMDKLCYACSKGYTDCVGTECYKKACSCAINVDKLCYACSKAYSDTKALCACVYASSCSGTVGGNACSFAVTCGHAIGSSCKEAARNGKADTYGNSCNCVYRSHEATHIVLDNYTYPEKRYIYFGNPPCYKNFGCNADFWYCPTCNILSMGSCEGAVVCLVGNGSCYMSGDGSKKNPKIVFSTRDGQCGCLQYTQFDSVHPGAGLCWATNQANTWFETDCVFAKQYRDSNGCLRNGRYRACIGSPNGVSRYVLLDFGATDTSVDFQVYNNKGTIVKTNGDNNVPVGSLFQENTYGVSGFYPIGGKACVWLRVRNYKPFYFFGNYPIKVVANTTTDPGCSWKSPTISASEGYVCTTGDYCFKKACLCALSTDALCYACSKGYTDTKALCSCVWASSCGHAIGCSCKGEACSFTVLCTGGYAKCYGGSSSCVAYAKTASIVNTYNNYTLGCYSGDSDRPVAVTSASGCYNMQTALGFVSSTAKPFTYNPYTGILKVGGTLCTRGGICPVAECCYVANVGGFCKSAACTYANTIATCCRNAACSFTSLCASKYAKCYGSCSNCVEVADKVMVNITNNNSYFQMPFVNYNSLTPRERNFYIDGGNAYPSYNPYTNVFCGYTVCVAQTLAVRNGNGGFRMGNYCIYIE